MRQRLLARRRTGRGVTLGLCLFAPAEVARADILTLYDGTMHRGEVVEQTPQRVRFRCQVSGIWSKLSFPAGKVYMITREEGDQSDLGLDDDAEADEDPDDDELASAETGTVVAVIPLHGSVGRRPGRSAAHSFTAEQVRQRLERAERDGAELVVLDIDSPGGLVNEMEAICELVAEWGDRVPIVAYPKDALSAAAIITMCCRRIAVRPESRIGAAVIIRTGEGGPSALDAKMASPHHARQRQYMARSGHPYDVVAAMTIQPTELWWSAEDGFTTASPAKPGRDDWEKVDDRSSVLTMTDDQALAWGIAEIDARSLHTLVRRLGVQGAVEVVSLDRFIERDNEEFDRRIEALGDQLTAYFDALGALRDAMNEFADAANSGRATDPRRMRREISTQVRKADAARSAILRLDRVLIEHRFETPEPVLERLREDARLLAEIRRLSQAYSVNEYNRAVDRLNRVLGAWRALISGG